MKISEPEFYSFLEELEKYLEVTNRTWRDSRINEIEYRVVSIDEEIAALQSKKQELISEQESLISVEVHATNMIKKMRRALRNGDQIEVVF